MNLAAILLSAFMLTAPQKPAADASSNSDLTARVMQLEEQNRKLQGRVEELDHRLAQMDMRPKAQAQPELPKPISLPAPVIPAPAKIKPVVEAAPPEPKKDEDATPNADFDKAFNFMTDGNNAEAKKSFAAFVKKYPNSSLSGESYYWLGEMAFDEKDYNNAAIDYLKGYRDYPKGAKAPENILKLAETLKKLGRSDEACQNLSRFKTEFQNAHANLRARADSYRQELRCK